MRQQVNIFNKCNYEIDFLFQANSYDIDESPFDTLLEDLKECDFDDQKEVEGCVVVTDGNDDVEETKTVNNEVRSNERSSGSAVTIGDSPLEPMTYLNETTGLMQVSGDKSRNSVTLNIKPNTSDNQSEQRTIAVSCVSSVVDSFTTATIRQETSVFGVAENNDQSSNITEIASCKLANLEVQTNEVSTKPLDESNDSSSSLLSHILSLKTNVPNSSCASEVQISLDSNNKLENQSKTLNENNAETSEISGSLMDKERYKEVAENLFSCGFSG